MADTAAALTRDDVVGNIRAEMARRRVTGGAVAARLGLSRPSVSQRLNGHVAFDVDELIKVAELLGVEPSHLLTRSTGCPDEVAESRAA